MSRAKALLKNYLDEMQNQGGSRWTRKTEFTEGPDGSIRSQRKKKSRRRAKTAD